MDRKDMAVFGLLFLSTSASALFNRIMDCDEYMNYWEPTHFLTYGKGLQTWEYSPQYSLRSYAYVGIFSAIARLFNYIASDQTDKITIFFMIKSLIGVFTSISQFIFYKGVEKRFGKSVGTYTWLFMVLAPGFFLSSSTMLPTTLSMAALMMAYGFSMLSQPMHAVFMCAVSVFLGWPFVVVLAAPLAFDVIIRYGLFKALKWALVPVAVVFLPMVLIDHYFYGKWVVAIYNIIVYNFTASHSGGSQLYGVEPWYFYVLNSFVNFNVVFLASVVAVPVVLVLKRYSASVRSLPMIWILFILSPYYIWFAFMSYLPHKEERFLFIIYPFLCLAGALTLSTVVEALNHFARLPAGKSKKDEDAKKTAPSKGALRFLSASIKYLFLLSFVLLSVSRIYSTWLNYDAPVDTFIQLNRFLERDPYLKTKPTIDICVGKEWHRFPSNFFIPRDTADQTFNVKFLRSSFKGQLPKPFGKGLNATRVTPSGFNDQNKEEYDRYFHESRCDFIVDTDFPHQTEKHYARDTEDWDVIYSRPYFYKSERPMFRAFYIPTFSEKYNKFCDFNILRNKQV